jgi:hypothetical protein
MFPEARILQMSVWFIMVQLRPLPGSTFPGPPTGKIYVECYVPAATIFDALQSVQNLMREECYEILDHDRLIRFDINDWDFDEYPKDSTAYKIAKRILRTDKIELGPFCY